MNIIKNVASDLCRIVLFSVNLYYLQMWLRIMYGSNFELLQEVTSFPHFIKVLTGKIIWISFTHHSNLIPGPVKLLTSWNHILQTIFFFLHTIRIVMRNSSSLKVIQSITSILIFSKRTLDIMFPVCFVLSFSVSILFWLLVSVKMSLLPAEEFRISSSG